jgi:hypothetical protein
VPAVYCASKPAIQCACRFLCQQACRSLCLPFIVPTVHCACRSLSQQASQNVLCCPGLVTCWSSPGHLVRQIGKHSDNARAKR